MQFYIEPPDEETWAKIEEIAFKVGFRWYSADSRHLFPENCGGFAFYPSGRGGFISYINLKSEESIQAHKSYKKVSIETALKLIGNHHVRSRNLEY